MDKFKKQTKMRQQVLSIEQMKHLQELGLDTDDASMRWEKRTRMFNGDLRVGHWILDLNIPIILKDYHEIELIPTFTLQDILELLPKQITAEPLIHTFSLFIDYQHSEIHYACVHKGGYTNLNPTFEIKDNLIDAAYELLCWCIENGYIETKKQNV